MKKIDRESLFTSFTKFHLYNAFKDTQNAYYAKNKNLKWKRWIQSSISYPGENKCKPYFSWAVSNLAAGVMR